jgi:hypothetical protein
MITLICGDQSIKVHDDEARRILNIQKIMKATKWQIKNDINIRSDKGTGRKKASQKGN